MDWLNELDDFEYDAAVLPGRARQAAFSCLAGKSVLVTGGSPGLVLAVGRCLRALPLPEAQLPAVTLAGVEDVPEQESMTVLLPGQVLEQVDYWIDTGLMETEGELDAPPAAATSAGRLLLASPDAVYGACVPDICYAEGEWAAEEGQLCRAARQYEGQARQRANSMGAEFVCLRSGMLLGKGYPVFPQNTPLGGVWEAVKEKTFPGGRAGKQSYLYIGDWLGALLVVLTKGEREVCYNAAHPDMDGSDGEVAAYLSALCPQAAIHMEEALPAGRPRWLRGQRLALLGWSPRLCLKEALGVALAGSGAIPQEALVLDRQYGGRLPALQRILLEMLGEIDRLCQKNGIAYSLAGGTLLGAVRQGAIIPWDDDVDIMMDRGNYDRFVQVASKELPAHLFLQCEQTDPLWHYAYAKVRLQNTCLATAFSSQFSAMHSGIFIDVFVQDATADSNFLQKWHIREICFWHAVVRHLWWRKADRSAACDSSRLVRLVSRLVPLSFAQRRQDRAVRRYQRKNTRFLIDSTGMHPRLGAYPREWLANMTPGRLGEKEFPILCAYDEYLRYLYGEYTRPAPISERHPSHRCMTIDLGPYAGE